MPVSLSASHTQPALTHAILKDLAVDYDAQTSRGFVQVGYLNAQGKFVPVKTVDVILTSAQVPAAIKARLVDLRALMIEAAEGVL